MSAPITTAQAAIRITPSATFNSLPQINHFTLPAFTIPASFGQIAMVGVEPMINADKTRFRIQHAGNNEDQVTLSVIGIPL
ncbi:hypothetical protein [Sulfuriferula multivorans]|uniref:hypothetical protein n=1 Tax=Sulfuriferula multivorans TaxID=1559896 RepID=UPI000F5BB70A|nr:hypothetical protein [Sulfuriferula multivorans]